MFTRSQFLVRWIAGTMAGWIIAMIPLVIVVLIIQYFQRKLDQRVSDSTYAVLVLVTFVLAGAAIGFVQWQIVLKHSAINDRMPRWRWIVASAIMGLCGLVGLGAGSGAAPALLRTLSDTTSTLDDKFQLLNSWPTAVLGLGLFLGTGLGLPTWILLYRYLRGANWWMVANMLGGVAILAVFALIVSVIQGSAASEGLICLVGPLVFAAITGTVLYRLLQIPYG